MRGCVCVFFVFVCVFGNGVIWGLGECIRETFTVKLTFRSWGHLETGDLQSIPKFFSQISSDLGTHPHDVGKVS